MTMITIPKELDNANDLVAVPRYSYEEFSVWQRKVKSLKTFNPTSSEKKALERGRKEMAMGEHTTLEELEYELETTHRKKR